MNWQYILSIALLVFGFGFVIFWHELGHFLAAKWVGIRVEQFAVGFGQALLSFRKGMGVQVGTSGRRYEELQKAAAEGDATVDVSKYGETEYRLNWIPLGGYVKMLGQDDLNPNAETDDPRSYNRKSVPARMLVVSAGVIMNVILAAFLFMALFRYGFSAPAPVVGEVVPGSPAQRAGVQVGDRLLTYEGKQIHDFTKLMLNVALSDDGTPVPLEVRRTIGDKEQTLRLEVTPARTDARSQQFVQLGVAPPTVLAGPPAPKQAMPADELKKLELLVTPEQLAVRPGDVITRVNDTSVDRDDIRVLYEALQQAGGKPVTLTVRDAAGAERQERVTPQFAPAFGRKSFDLAGLTPLPRIVALVPGSPAIGKLEPGDVILSASFGTAGDTTANMSREELVKKLLEAGEKRQAVALTVLRDGQEKRVEGLTPNMKLESGGRGLGIAPADDLSRPVVGTPVAGTPAAQANIEAGSAILAIGGQPVQNWHDLFRILSSAKPGATPVQLRTRAGETRTVDLTLNEQQIGAIAANHYTHTLALGEMKEVRHTDSVFTAARWGVTETRDFILQFYLTLRRMADGNVAPSNLMGPIGIFQAGTHFANRGNDWLIWFLAMISANLAVVNFLPIPIVDGGLFTFLIIEKIKGRPVSARTQSIAQVAGLVLLLGVFLFVTYNDITRLF